MALVAYGSSGDSDSDYDDDEPTASVPTIPSKPAAAAAAATANQTNNTSSQLFDDETAESASVRGLGTATFKLNLPAPKAGISEPLAGLSNAAIVEEEDDEFLRKKPTAYAVEKPPPPPKPVTGGKVKIVLPLLSSFAEHTKKERPVAGAALPSDRPHGLLGMLPAPKSVAAFGSKVSAATGKASNSLVPDSISRPKPKAVAVKPVLKKPNVDVSGVASTSKTAPAAAADSDGDDDDDACDFFSFNTDDQLPEVSDAEIAALVARKSDSMSKARRDQQLEQEAIAAEIAAAAAAAEEARRESAAASSSSSSQMDRTALEALCGSRAATKRSRHGGFAEADNIIELRGDQLTDRDEWLRQQLTGKTEYQPRGLIDTSEGPGAGTKRKHQITYLAHQAKANEQELQAMWAANRNTRRQTQNKYGF